ncbi:MAG: phosphatidate cytidylyltransferase [Phaeodactylibacter sp.]|nr:phosphatidate cytidylyltransferase [Phaeodactylibacter sp.]MCB9276114.1 phosphatidate cytidylyltransferase [Lewinellaceae bacterium]
MNALLRRGATALIFVAAMLGGIYGGRHAFVLLFALITGLCLWEFFNIVLLRNQKRDLIRRWLGIILGMVPYLLASVVQLDLVQQKESFIAIASLLFFPVIFSAFIYELYSKAEQPFANVAFIVLGMAYIGVPFALLEFIAFEDGQFHANTVFGLLAMTWVNDTGAYLVGSRFGKTLLFPRISPKKTWEGAAGAAILTLLAAVLIHQWLGSLRLIDWLALATIVVLFGSLGDLVESMLKRSAKLKDSGTILPGHGGLLDRFDGFIFLLPFATAYILWVRMAAGG